MAIEKTGDFPDATPLKKPAVLWKWTTKPRDGAKPRINLKTGEWRHQ